MQAESISHAIETYTNFVKVQKGNPREIRLEAIDTFALGSGLDQDEFDTLCDYLDNMIDSPGGEFGWAVIGFIMGLYAADKEVELAKPEPCIRCGNQFGAGGHGPGFCIDRREK